MRNEIDFRRLIISAALIGALVFVALPSVSAALISLSKNTVPPDAVYFVGETVFYELQVSNPDPTYGCTLDIIYDILPSGTMLVLAIDRYLAPGASCTFNVSYVVREEDVVNGSVINTLYVEGENDIAESIWGACQKTSWILSPPPEFAFTYEQVCCFNMSFCGLASDPENITNHTWDFGDGYWYASDGAPGMVTHQYFSCGTKLVSLSGYDNEVAFNMTTKAVYVPCAPTAIAAKYGGYAIPRTCCINFNGSLSYADPKSDLDIATYHWEFSDGFIGSNDDECATLRCFFKNNIGDIILANLTVSDGHCFGTDEVVVMIVPNTIYVPDYYETIQEAVDNAASGDTIIVRDGIYQENVDVNVNNLTIKSENGSENCIIQAANPNDHVFEVTANYVNMSGFTISNNVSGNGIYIDCSSDVVLSNNIILNNNNGIALEQSRNSTLFNNTIKNNIEGIDLDASCGNLIFNNVITLNDCGIGLDSPSDNNKIIGNNISMNNGKGIILDGDNDGNRIIENVILYNGEEGISLGNFTNDNLIYNNYFNNAINAFDEGYNIWNLTKTAGTNVVGGSWLGGNYWSDYTGEDLSDDCLGDTLTPYNASGNIVNGGDYLPLVFPYTHTDVGATVDIELSDPSDLEPYLPPETNLSNAIVITANVTDETPENATDDAYTDITINVGALDVATCEVFKEGFGFLDDVDDITTLPTVKPPGVAKFARDVVNNSVIIRLYVGDPLLAVVPSSAEDVFDTEEGTYPSIAGIHNGTITPFYDINVAKMYTYPCPGTGGHTEYAKISNKSWSSETVPWTGYVGDWHNLTFNETFVLSANESYNFTIKTGSYPQIHHNRTLQTANGWINCTEFTDVNGKTSNSGIPAIRLE